VKTLSIIKTKVAVDMLKTVMKVVEQKEYKITKKQTELFIEVIERIEKELENISYELHD